MLRRILPQSVATKPRPAQDSVTFTEDLLEILNILYFSSSLLIIPKHTLLNMIIDGPKVLSDWPYVVINGLKSIIKGKL